MRLNAPRGSLPTNDAALEGLRTKLASWGIAADAQQLVDGQEARLVAGVNLPMLLRSISYRHEPLDDLVARALSGGAQGVVQLCRPHS